MLSMGVIYQNRGDFTFYSTLTSGMVLINLLSIVVMVRTEVTPNIMVIMTRTEATPRVTRLLPWAWWCSTCRVWVYIVRTEVIPRII